MSHHHVVARLAPRHIEVVRLIGGHGLSYKAAASRIRNKIVRVEPGTDAPTISYRTVQQYACEVRDLMGSDLAPKRALWELWRFHHKEIEGAA